MATCPKCLGPLSDGHRCPGGVTRRITDALSTVGIGALVGGAAAMLVNEQAPASLVLAAAALGAVLASAVRQAVVGRRP